MLEICSKALTSTPTFQSETNLIRFQKFVVLQKQLFEIKIELKNYSFLKCQKIFKKYFRYFNLIPQKS